MPKKDRRKLKKELVTLAKTVAKLRDNYTCQKCYKTKHQAAIHGSHVIPVSAGDLLSWDVLNIKALCYSCHFHWWHKDPIEASEWFEEKFPGRAAYLNAKRVDAHENPVRPKPTYEELLEDKRKLKEAIGGYN